MSSSQDLAKQAKEGSSFTEQDLTDLNDKLESVAQGKKNMDPEELYSLLMYLAKLTKDNKEKMMNRVKGSNRISESKGAANLKTFTGSKQEFQEWLDKLINQFNVTHPKSRLLFRRIIKEVNTKKSILTEKELTDIRVQDFQEITEERAEIISEDLHYILTDKTSGEAKSKVDTAEQGEGFKAFMLLIMWYSTSSGEAITERIKRIMSPGAPKKDEDLSQAVDTWVKENREVQEYGVKDLPIEFKITALKIIMSNHLERFDAIDREVRSIQGDDEKLLKMIDSIRDYATELRLRKIKPFANPFVDEVMAEPQAQEECEEDWSWWNQWDQAVQGIYAMAKGKSKGKGKPKGYKGAQGGFQGGKGPYQNNQVPPNVTYDKMPTWYEPSRDSRLCWKCGDPNHIAANCPHYPPGVPGVKGFKGKGKGKGKGLSSVEAWPDDDLMNLGGLCCITCPTRQVDVMEFMKEDKEGFRKVEHKKKSRKKSKRHLDIQCITRDNTIAQVSDDQGWEKMSIKIDSGAIDTCVPPSVGQAFKIQESHMSKNQATYRAANGTTIKNHGQRSISALDESWSPFKINAQVADVSTPLASVYQMCKSGNIVAFNSQGGAIINPTTGKKIPIKLRNGSYEMDMWMPKSCDTGQDTGQDSNSRAVEELSMDFIRRGL